MFGKPGKLSRGDLEEQVKKLEEEYLRAVSDAQNIKRRGEERVRELQKTASQKVIENLLPIKDNMKRAEENIPEDMRKNSWVKGVLHIFSQFSQVLKEEGLEIIEPKGGEEFDPNVSESVLLDSSQEEGKISQCLEPGCSLNGKVLRYAKVSVGSKTRSFEED
jgi:molecular chaperone GrpE